MPWEPVTARATDIKEEIGRSYEGTYRGSRKITTPIGEQTIWEFTNEEGLGFGIYGFTNLNRAMEAISPGHFVKITYLGTQNVKTKFGMKDVHQVDVQVWKADGEPEEQSA